MAETERLDGRDGKIWTAYVGGVTQETIAAEHGISQQRVSQVLAEVRESLSEAERMDAALLAHERAHALLAAVWPGAMAGDTKAVHAALKVLERQAKALGTDATEPLQITLGRRLDLEGEVIASSLRAAFDALELSPEQQAWAAYAASAALYRSAGEEPPMPPPPPPRPAASASVGDEAPPPDPRAGMEARMRERFAGEEGVDVDALLAEVDGKEREDG